MSTRAPKTLNPNFQQTFTFSFNRSSHRYSFLRITIYDAARRKKHMSVGHAILPYVETCVKFGSPVDYELVLGKSSVIHGAIGDIYITLSYTPMEKCLTVGLLRVRHLAVTEMVGCVNKELHAKVSLLFTGENVKTMKSGIICPSSRSFINEKFRFFVPAAVFDDITLVVTLVVCSVFSDDAPIGRVTVGPYFRSGEGALNYWGVLVQTERVVKGWYTLHL
ncbi:synaptotagmin-15-like [Liolophura sinensis]|uniref:synaptotagmin-15-like n=1 Tax=Liolophura sinensis TaxID=3198878 RepID=UPI003158233B